MSKKVYLSPSVQEKNIGADDYGTEEYRMNQVADVVESELIRHGIEIKRNKPSYSLYEIKEESNNYNPDLHMAIHSNAYDKKSRGCEVFCFKKDGSTGNTLANNVYLELAPITPTSDRGVKEGYNYYGTGKHMYELYQTKAHAALVEVDFHDNAGGAKWIIENIEPIGIAIAKGVLKTLGITWMTRPVLGYYRVVAGSYEHKENAQQQQQKLKSLNIDSFIEFKKL